MTSDPPSSDAPPAPTSHSPLDDLVGYALRRAQLRLYDDLHATLAAWDMTPARFSALTVIGANPGMKAAVLADTLGIARSGVVVLLNGLQAMGYVTRAVALDDRRTQALRLTREGRSALSAMARAVRAHDRRATDALDDDERRVLLSLLARIG